MIHDFSIFYKYRPEEYARIFFYKYIYSFWDTIGNFHRLIHFLETVVNFINNNLYISARIYHRKWRACLKCSKKGLFWRLLRLILIIHRYYFIPKTVIYLWHTSNNLHSRYSITQINIISKCVITYISTGKIFM